MNHRPINRGGDRQGRLIAREWLALVVAMLAVLAVVWWGRRGAPWATVGRHGAATEVVSIGLNAWPGYLPLFVAQDKGYFREQGVSVKLVMYDNFSELSRDYVAGTLEARGNLTFDAVHEALQGLEHEAVLVIDYSHGADAIVGRPGVPDIKGLAGKRVGYEAGSLEEFFLAFALSAHQMSLQDIVAVSTTTDQVMALLRTGQLDAAVTHEPFLTKIVKEGIAQELYSTREAPGLITDILTCRRDFIDAHPDQVSAILRAYFQGLAFWRAQPAEAQRIAAQACGTSPEAIGAQLATVSLPNERENEAALSFATAADLTRQSLSLYGNLRQIGEFVLSHQSGGPKEFDTDQLIDRRFIRELVNGSPLNSRRHGL